MSKEEVLGYFYKNSSEYGVKTTLLILLCGLAVGMIIYLTYYISSEKIAYNRKFNWSLVTLHLITVVVMLMISSNIAVSLGMVGALSIVRFRNAVKNPMDLLYLFWSISVGIICGAGFAVVAVVASIVITVIILLFDRVPSGAPAVILLVNASDYKTEGRIMEIVEKHCGMSKVKARNLTKDKLSMAVEVKTGEGGSLVEELMDLESVTLASLVDHDGEVTF